MPQPRSLYECQNAKVKGTRIVCAAGHQISTRDVKTSQLARGDKLVYQVCQDCLDFDCNGHPFVEAYRGWKKGKQKFLAPAGGGVINRGLVGTAISRADPPHRPVRDLARHQGPDRGKPENVG